MWVILPHRIKASIPRTQPPTRTFPFLRSFISKIWRLWRLHWGTHTWQFLFCSCRSLVFQQNLFVAHPPSCSLLPELISLPSPQEGLCTSLCCTTHKEQMTAHHLKNIAFLGFTTKLKIKIFLVEYQNSYLKTLMAILQSQSRLNNAVIKQLSGATSLWTVFSWHFCPLQGASTQINNLTTWEIEI